MELLTLKAERLLKEADVVVYDRLVGPSILALIPPKTQCIDVGKEAGCHTMPQEKINQLLLDKALEGKKVLRLKGGDPFVFGRGGEEIELLAEHGVEFEVVPGVTSATAVPAYNGIPLTHRAQASSVHIITGHRKKDASQPIDYKALVRLEGTLVFLMGVSSLEEICQGLMDAGMRRDMPCGLLQQGTTSSQRKLIAPISSLATKARELGFHSPAIIVVGEVCNYSETFSWYEKKPLFGRKILVTRPNNRNAELALRLRRLGAEVIEVPCIVTEKIVPNQRLYQAIDQLKDYTMLVFTSPQGVQIFFEELKEKGKDLREFGNGRIAVMGKGTAKELAKYSIFYDYMPEVYDALHLGKCIAQHAGQWEKILIPRARNGSEELIEEIMKCAPAQIHDIPTYDTLPNISGLKRQESLIRNKEITDVIFTSSSGVKAFCQAFSHMDLSNLVATCIGQKTADTAAQFQLSTQVAPYASIDGIVDTIVGGRNRWT